MQFLLIETVADSFRFGRSPTVPSPSWFLPLADVKLHPMKRSLLTCLFFFNILFIHPRQNATTKSDQAPAPNPLYWAYALNPASTAKSGTPTDKPQHVPDSPAAFTPAKIGDLYHVPDWHPEDHPAMPGVVAQGEKPDLYACGYCHLPNGQGRPENANLAGLPAAYIVQQMGDFKSGLRKSSEPRHLPSAYMVRVAKQARADKVRIAAKYFTRLKPKPWIRVMESATVPKTQVVGWMLVASEGGETEPIGERIIEMPEDLERTELRDDRSGFMAYVPVRSIVEGKKLASGEGGKTIRCSTCHGDYLRGYRNVPGIAGRSPSYLVRQLNDMQNGNRHGAGAGLMKPVVQNLAVEDMVALAAYCASLKP